MFHSDIQHLDQQALARRWSLSPRTLEKWRTQQRGPGWIKAGSRVVYPLAQVEAFEASNLRQAIRPTLR